MTNLAIDCRPNFQRVVIRTADNLVTTEFETSDNVVIMSFEHL